MLDSSKWAPCAQYVAPAIAVVASVSIAMIGWAISLETRVQKAITIVDERGPRISTLERHVGDLFRIASDPSPKPETKVAVADMRDAHDRLEQRLSRLEERVNNLHGFVRTYMQPPFKEHPQRRGDIDLLLPPGPM